MSARAKAKRGKPKSKAAAHPTFRRMVLEAIAASSHWGRGASRAFIANYIKNNYKGLGEQTFNSALRRALAGGIEAGVLAHGETNQRYKLTDAGRKERNPPKKKKPKKKKAAPKRKRTAKKKTTKKKTTKKRTTKKKTTKRKKAAPKRKTTKKRTTKRKTTSKKRAAPKKRGGRRKAAPKRKGSRKRKN